LSLIALSIFNCSCRKLILINPPKNQLTPDKVFDNDSSVIAATANMYLPLSTVDASFVDPSGIYTDELITTNVDATSAEFTNSTLTVNDSKALSIWQNLYSCIYKSNSLIAGILVSKSISDSTKNQCLGEAYFLRAYSHFMLTNIYGDVPLILTTSVNTNAIAARTSSATVMKHVLSDLTTAVSLLSAQYPSSGDKVRANKWTAAGLLAKADLYSGNYIDAESQCSSIINSGQYSLLSNLNQVFLANSDEAIFQLWNANGYTTVNSVPASGKPTFQVASDLQNAFEPGDMRFSDWVNSATVSGKTYYYPFKYKQRRPATGNAEEYTMYIRLGEIYLIRAEARAREDILPGAASDLNTIRSRAGLGNTAATTQTDLLTAIVHERQIELFNESGNRFFDLKRFGLINTIMPAVKPLWKTTGDIFPIPQSEVLKDPYLTQNPGYLN